MNIRQLWDLNKDKIAAGVVTAVILAVLAFAIGLLGLPVKVSYLEEQARRIPAIETSVAEVKANQLTFNKTTDEAAKTVKEFNQETKNLTAANAKLEANINALTGLSTDIRDLRKATDELRNTSTQISGELKRIAERSPQERPEVAGIVFLSEGNTKQDGNMFTADFQYPENLAGRPVREVRARMGPVIPIQGVSMLSSLVETRPSGYTLRILAHGKEEGAVAQFLRKQPIRVEVIYVMDK